MLVKINKLEMEKRIKAYFRKFKIKQESYEFPYIVLMSKFHKDFKKVTFGFGSYLVETNKKNRECF